MDTELYARLRRPASQSTIPGTLPVLFFGTIKTAKIALIGFNPSPKEYLDNSGTLLQGYAQRFETLETLEAHSRAALTITQCDRAIAKMEHYFNPGRPVYGWFNAPGRVAEPMGYSFKEGSAVQLDLVQEATDPSWSKLEKAESDALLAADESFLRWELETFPFLAVLCNGKTVYDTVRKMMGGETKRSGQMARINWYAGTATTGGRTLGIAGWNYPLDKPTGLGAVGENTLGVTLANELRALGIHL